MQKYRGGRGWVDFETVRPVFDRLLDIYGTQAALAYAMQTTKQTISSILKRKRINQATLDKALALLAEYEISHKKSSIPLEVVDATRLALILRGWVVKYLEFRSPETGDFTGPTAAIAFWANMSEKNVSRYINNTDLAQPWVDVNVAEVLLIAIGEENTLRDGTLEVFPNPSLSMEQWVKRMRSRGCI